MSEVLQHSYEFGPFRLDGEERQLWRDGEEVSLTPKAFGVLLMLHKPCALIRDDFASVRGAVNH